jgi:hypothetical protein
MSLTSSADSEGMTISEQQARRAARYVEPPAIAAVDARLQIPPELMSRILGAVEAAPDPRLDRVAEARARLVLGVPAPDQIAEQIIAQAVSDALS